MACDQLNLTHQQGMAALTVLSALPVARIYSLKGLKAKQFTSAVCASCCCTVSATDRNFKTGNRGVGMECFCHVNLTTVAPCRLVRTLMTAMTSHGTDSTNGKSKASHSIPDIADDREE